MKYNFLQPKPIFLVIAVLFLSTNQVNVYAQSYSQLWGTNGEKWDKKRIPDFTQAGYKSGQEAIPSFSVGVNVKDFGAVGDSITDNTIAFRKAIAKCGANKAIYIPAGVYLLTDTIMVSKSNIAFRGDKNNTTVLYFKKGIEELYPNYNLENKNQTKWSWSGAMLLFNGDNSNVGIENLTIKFPDNPWAGHDFHERCYNGVGFGDGVHDGWIRNVIFMGADLGIWVSRKAHHITAEKWVLDFGPVRKARKLNGHHGVNIYGGYNLLQDFELKGKFQHDLSVESENSMYNVFRNGKGPDMCIDHHNHAQRNNLFTNLDMGAGTRLYASGGVETPRGISFNETYWNITAVANMKYCNEQDAPTKHSSNNVCVGIKTTLPSVLNDEYGNWFETIDPTQLSPKDLYLAQKQLKKTTK